MKSHNKRLALFDFDGTITSKDTFIDFIIYIQGYPKYVMGILQNIHYLIAYKAGLYPNDKAKEKVLSYFFKGMKSDKFKELAARYSKEQLPKIIKPSAMEKVKWHLSMNHEVVIVSASMECWLKEWCVAHNVELISTRLEVRDGIITGKLATKNCHGQEKVNRIKKHYNLGMYEYIYAYGDSKGDREMLGIADERGDKSFSL
ncbi:MAG: HAD-IB family hydrolase [Candidatus Marinimicrobia bacterium]|nr:HAD-IB family hydrolase [Candidatus Neomarinimicrobiota bacterium]